MSCIFWRVRFHRSYKAMTAKSIFVYHSAFPTHEKKEGNKQIGKQKWKSINLSESQERGKGKILIGQFVSLRYKGGYALWKSNRLGKLKRRIGWGKESDNLCNRIFLKTSFASLRHHLHQKQWGPAATRSTAQHSKPFEVKTWTNSSSFCLR